MSKEKFTSPEFVDRGDVPRSAERSHRVAWILGAVAVVLVCLLIPGIILAVQDRGDSADQDVTPNVGGTAQSDEPNFGELTWKPVGRTDLPYSSVAGPHTQEGVTARGFSHSRAGAILAAWQIPTRLAVLTGGTDAIYEKQVLGTQSERDDLRNIMSQVQTSYAPDQTVPRPLAWRENTYQDRAAAFDFAVPGETSREVRLARYSVVWVGGDWKYQPGLFGSAKTGPVDAESVNPGNGWRTFESAGS